MSKIEMNDEAKIEEFIDDLSDEALDREEGRGTYLGVGASMFCRVDV